MLPRYARDTASAAALFLVNVLQVWSNAVEAVLQLLEAGALPDLQDGESGW